MELTLEDTLKHSREKKESKLLISNGFLAEIPDLHEYEWIEELKIINNKITQIDSKKLPPKLKKLDLGKNNIEKVESVDLVPSIETLNLSHNKLVEFDGEQFPNLKILHIAFNDIVVFTFPPNIVELTIKRNRIKYLSDLPNTMKIFDCGDNDLTDLPNMNEGLEKIDFSSNRLTAFPYFPDSVTLIIGSSNKIKNVFFLPASLQNLELRDNHISTIACPLPYGLITLDLAENLITDMPILPKNIQEINLNNNRINEFGAIPDSVKSIDISNNLLQDDPRIFIPDDVELICDNNLFNIESDDNNDTTYKQNYTSYDNKDNIGTLHGINNDSDDDKLSDMEGFWSTDYPTRSYYFDNDLDYKPSTSTSTYNYNSSTNYNNNSSTTYNYNTTYKPNYTNYGNYSNYTPSKTNYKFKSSNPNYISVNYKKNIVV